MKELEEYLNSKIGLTNNKNLEALHRFFTKDQLENLMDKTIAIVGTNGKTSTANFIYNLLGKEEKQVLMFTSPHLVNFQERIQSHSNINFDYISRIVHDFEIENNITLGYFETLFLIACKAFLDNEMDYFICEAGIGGVLDTTSIIQSKNVVLTNIGRDHQELLGYTDLEVLDQKIENDLIDKDIDRKVSRTQNRALASSQISLKNSLILLFFLLIIGLIILLQLNYEAIVLGLVITPLIILYPLAKRFFFLPQLILALTYNWGCFIGWVAMGSNVPFSSVLILYVSLIFWTLTYDTIYATQDEKEDKELKLYSSTLFFGAGRMIILNLIIFFSSLWTTVYTYVFNFI